MVLGRGFHADRFVVGDDPSFLMLFFGGSGTSRAEYELRAGTIIPAFNDALHRVTIERPTVPSFVLLYVTSPYDLALDDLAENGSAWRQHLVDELLPQACAHRTLPVYASGYSGGALLGIDALRADVLQTVIGAGFLGADGVSAMWADALRRFSPITVFYNLDDRVFDANAAALRTLDSSIVEWHRRLPGTHALDAYVKNGSFAGLLRRAHVLSRESSV